MSVIDIAPHASSTLLAGEEWLRKQAGLNWRESGLPDFDNWDVAIAVVARLVACSASPMALMMGPKGVLLANEAAERLFVGSAGAVNGRSVLDVLPETRAFYAEILEKGLEGRSLSFQRQPVRLELEGDIRTHWFNLDFTPVCDGSGGVAGILGTASAISPLIHQIRELSESEQRLRVALEGSGMVGIWTLDVASGMSTADANVARMYGLPAEACDEGVEARHFFNAIHPDYRDKAKAAIARSIASGVLYRNRYRILDHGGGERWVITSAKPISNEEGAVTRLLGVVVEVTDQVETASALAESRFQFQTLTETLPQIVWSCDAEGRHDYFSARWSEFTGVNPHEIDEDTWKTLVDPEHKQMVDAVWEQALRSGEAYDLDYRFRHHSGEYRWLRVMALPIHDDDGRIVRWFGTSTDVHESYLMAEERERLARELERIATEDQLTGTFTRRAFIDRASKGLMGEFLPEEPLSLLMLDIDHFKIINDSYGHPVGDKVLAGTAQRVASSIRSQDFVGRLGGEEFAVFLPQCSRDEAHAIAERIRIAVEANPVMLDDGRQIAVTLSIGIACVEAGAEPLDALLAAADDALYQAKSGGRNQIRFA